MNRIALLIPVYNNPEGLRRSLATLPSEIEVDVVVVDDGSRPSIDIAGMPCPCPVMLLQLEQNRGIEHALNYGLGWILDHGYTYVARLDAEDIALPGRFLSQFCFLEEHPEHAMVGGQVRFVGLDGNEVYREALPVDHAAISRTMHVRNCFIHPAVMIRTAALRKIGIYSHAYRSAEDFELFFRLSRSFCVANLPEHVVICCLNPEGISSKARLSQMLSRIRIMLLYFDPLSAVSYFGLFKNVAMLAIPKPIITMAKRSLGTSRTLWT